MERMFLLPQVGRMEQVSLRSFYRLSFSGSSLLTRAQPKVMPSFTMTIQGFQFMHNCTATAAGDGR